MKSGIKLTRPAALKHSTSEPIYTVRMSVKDFVALERCTIQRCERLRVAKPHLKNGALSQWSVQIAILPDGSIFIVNGHTRRLKWIKKTLPEPDYLEVTVFCVETVEAVEELYEHFDSPVASKRGADVMQSGAHKMGVEFTTPWLKAGKYAAALDVACEVLGVSRSKVAKIDRPALFKNELVEFDKIPDLKRSKFPIGVLAATILAVRKHGAKAIAFTQSYSLGQAANEYGKKNAVQFLQEYISEQKSEKKMGGIERNLEHAAFTLACIERFIDGDPKLKRRPSVVELSTYLPAPPTTMGRVRKPRGSSAAIHASP